MGKGRTCKDPEKKQGMPRQSVGPWCEYVEDELGGTCAHCGQYDIELDGNGLCRSDDCKHDRIVQALLKGEARMLPNGVLVHTPGVKTFGDE
jgi:hypothetical protein